MELGALQTAVAHQGKAFPFFGRLFDARSHKGQFGKGGNMLQFGTDVVDPV